ncbi:hypothetical protein AltI4_37400 [Alteromonas sp. I4]|nr:hypothetical protein AltI4_37400 [Alteromonas sp. I4]
MLDSTTVILWLVVFAGLYAALGLYYNGKHQGTLDDFIVARNSQGSQATFATLLATTMGTWILFGPAESAVWGGVGAIAGYALGTLAPSFLMVPLGVRLRRIMPNGYALTEFVRVRYGNGVYGFVSFIMLFYMFIGLTAGLTGIAQLVALVAPIPLWITASIVMVATLAYTLGGGLKVSIFTDRIQLLVILPFIAILLLFGWRYTGGMKPVFDGLMEKAPQLLNPFDTQGLETGITFFLAVGLTGLFYQGTWQRIFAARNSRTLLKGFVFSGLLSFPVIAAMGLFGLAFVGLSVPGDGSTALFTIVLNEAPYWLIVGIILFGLALIMSSADSTISGLNSLFIIDLRRVFPRMIASELKVISRYLLVILSMIALYVASQGLSILYLFLLADLLCCAAAFPVFFGFYSQRYQSYQAIIGMLSGIVAGLFFFPLPGEAALHLYEAFLLATFVPVVVSLVLLLLPVSKRFEFSTVAKQTELLFSGK